MNILLTFLMMFHMAIWLFAIFGGLISPAICQFNILILVPVIYLIHILPLHIIVDNKIKHIINNLDKFDDIEYVLRPKKIEFLQNYIPKDVDNEKALKVMRIYSAEEDKLVIPKIHKRLEQCFENSFGNPLNAQGMLILAMIVSVYLLKFFWKAF